MFKRLDAVVLSWSTRRLLWVWVFAYACIITSGYLWPWTPHDRYFECPSWGLPLDASTHPPGTVAGNSTLLAPKNTRDLVVKGPILRLPKFKQAIGNLFPELRRVFVGGYGDSPEAFRRLCRDLPGIQVWHLDLNGGRLASTMFLLLVTLLLGGAVMQQASATFSMPQSRLYPQFVIPHLVPPLAICFAGIAIASLVARKYGSDFWATASLQVLAWGVWSALEFSLVGARPHFLRDGIASAAGPIVTTTSEGRSRWIDITAVLLAIVAVYVLFAAQPYVLESFLLGELPWLSVGFLAIGATLGASAIALAPRLNVALSEAGIAPVLSVQDIEKRRTAPSSLPMPFGRNLEHLRRLNRPSTWWWRIRAIEMGNPNLISSVLIKIVGPAAVVAICGRLFPLPLFSRAFVLLLVTVGWIAASASGFSTWWQRRKAFSVQLLYPWTRRQLTLSAFAAYAMDALGCLSLLFATVVACNLALDWKLGNEAILRGGLIAVGVAALLVTGDLLLLTLRHRLLANFLACGEVILVVGAMSLWWLTLNHGNLWHVLGTVFLPQLAAAACLGTAAYRRWMSNEWGLFGSP